MRLYPILKHTRLVLHVLRAQAQLTASRHRADVAYEDRHWARRVEKVRLHPPPPRACQHPSRRPHVRPARLPATLMEFLKGPIPTFLTTPRSLL